MIRENVPMRSSCHIYARNSGNFPLLTTQIYEYAMPHITAGNGIRPLGCQNWLVRLAACALRGVYVIFSNRDEYTVTLNRRRQTCLSSKHFWPLAFSPLLQLAPSRKNQWLSQWSWKNQQWIRCNTSFLRPGTYGARPNSIWRKLCQLSKQFWPLAFSQSSQPVHSRKNHTWRRLWKKHQQRSTNLRGVGAFSAHNHQVFSVASTGAVPC